MKLRIQRDHFFAGLQQVLNIIGSRPSLPVLNNVLLQAENGQLILTTTNLDIGTRCFIKADVSVNGTITLPAKRLATIIKSLPQNDVTIESVNHQIKITSGGSLFKIVGMGVEDFPPFNILTGNHTIHFSSSKLHNMLKHVAYAQSMDENRYILNGVYFHFSGDLLTVVATDGRRLALMKDSLLEPINTDMGFILPAKTVIELTRLLSQGERLKITFNDKQVAFIIDLEEDHKQGLNHQLILISKIVEGQFPNYQQVIPQQTAERIRLERHLFLDCIQRASFVASERHNAVKVRISNHLLEISGSSPEIGESHESIAIAYEGPEVQIAFNPQFLMDPLKALLQDEVIFEFKDDLGPGVFKQVSSNNEFLCVVMPLRSN
jgi:DNA polymerase-3 subunit beta